MINQKGGVGKTTATVNLGAGLARLGKSVLLMDLDPQAHLTCHHSINSSDVKTTMYDVISGAAAFQDVIVIKDGLTIAPAGLDLLSLDAELANTKGREKVLSRAWAEFKSRDAYDYALIDCPPSLGLLTVNALMLAGEVFVVMQPEFLALHGMGNLIRAVNMIQRIRRELKITGIIVNRFDGRKNLNRDVVADIRKYFPKAVFDTFIRENIALAEAPSFGVDVFQYAPSSNGAEDYSSLAEEVEKMKFPKKNAAKLSL